MKRRTQPQSSSDSEAALAALALVLSVLDRPEDVRNFLIDLCTPAELEAMSDRWKVVPLSQQGLTQRQIHDVTRISTTTIGRVERTYTMGTGGYKAALEALKRADGAH